MIGTTGLCLTVGLVLFIFICAVLACSVGAWKSMDAEEKEADAQKYSNMKQDPTRTQRVGGYLYHTGKIGPPRV